jgi:tetratricopeptide (TPR) repeat protein
MKINLLFALSLSLMACGIPTIVHAQPQPSSETTIAPKTGMAELQAAIKRDPKNLSAYYDLADYYGKDEPDEVVKIFDRVIAIAPSNPEIYEKFAMMATAYEYQGAPLQAITRRLITAQKALPKSPEISIYLAGLYGHSKQSEKAIAALQQGLKNGGDAKEFNMLLGHIELGLNKNPDRALRYYEKVVQIGGDYLCAEPYRFGALTELLVAQGKAPEAFALLKSTLQKSSGDAQENCILNFYVLSDEYPALGKETIALISPIILAQKEINRHDFMNLTALMMKQKQYSEVIALGDRLLAEKRSVPLLSMMDIVNAAKELKQSEKAQQWSLRVETLKAQLKAKKNANPKPKV